LFQAIFFSVNDNIYPIFSPRKKKFKKVNYFFYAPFLAPRRSRYYFIVTAFGPIRPLRGTGGTANSRAGGAFRFRGGRRPNADP
jgi:hypothetical protein